MATNLFALVKEHYNLLEYCQSLGWKINTSVSPYRCLSPFRQETQPSFCIYPETQSWTDFGDHSGGDIIALVARLDDLEPWEACRQLAETTGLLDDRLEARELRAQSALYAERQRCEQILTMAGIYYHDVIYRGNFQHIWDDYFKKDRGFNDETIQNFKLGFADGKLYKYLSLFFSDDKLLATGLFIPTNRGLIDYFVGRAIYPYWHQGKIVYMIARELMDVTPKTKYEYYESGEPIKFKKLRVYSERNSYISKTISNDWLYGIDSIRDAKEILITEGVADCISAIQSGIPCLSPVTTQIRKKDINQIVKLCSKAERVIICNDNEENESGIVGAERTAIALAKNGLSVFVAELPRDWENKIDVNDFIKTLGPKAFKEILAESPSVIDFLAGRITEEQKSLDLSKALYPILSVCATYNSVDKEKALNHLSVKLGLTKAVLKGALAEHKNKDRAPELKSMDLKIDSTGDIIDSDGNLAMIFRNHPKIIGTLGYNSRNTMEYILAENPFSCNRQFPQELSDSHVSNAVIWLQNSLGITTRRVQAVKNAIVEACDNSDINKTYDPIEEWINSIDVWDNKKRIETIFIDYFGVEDTQLHREYGRCFCISLVARCKIPGCKLDTAPILIGDQGMYKSTFFKTLVPEDKYFMDTKITFSNRDGLMMLHGPWIIEMSELSSVRSMDTNAIKTIFSSSSDMYRKPWGTHIEEFPRTCVIVGTSNEEHFLKDLTGNRRYWPMIVNKKANINKLVKNKNQILAEALFEFKAGKKWYLEEVMEASRQAEESNYMEENSDIDIIENYLSLKEFKFEGLKLINPEINYDLMFDKKGNRIFITQLEMIKIDGILTKSGTQKARILKSLGWERKIIKDTIDNKTLKLYYNSNLIKKSEVARYYNAKKLTRIGSKIDNYNKNDLNFN